MTHLFIAISAFLASHLIPAVPAVRSRLIGLLGWRGYLIAYSGLSLAVLTWVALAYRGAPYVEVWPYDPGLRWVPVLVMAPASMLLVIGLARPNPLSVSLWKEGAEPLTAIGAFGILRHPVLWAFALWAGGHAVPNGDLASLTLFGLMALLSVGGMHGLDAKRRRVLGADRWRRLARRRFRVGQAEIVGGVIGLGLYGLVAALHEPVIGVSPWPPGVRELIIGG